MSRETSDKLRRFDFMLDRVIQGDVDPTIKGDPQDSFTEEIGSLLEMAQRIHAELPIPSPRKSFQVTAKQRILRAVRIKAKHPSTRPRAPRRWRRSFRMATVPIAAVLAVVALVSSTTIASANALPGTTLYGVKRGIEEVRLFITLQPDEDALLLLEFSNVRINEANQLAELGELSGVDLALDEYIKLIDRLTHLASESTEIEIQEIRDISDEVSNQSGRLQQLQDRLGESASSALEEAMSKSSHGQEVLEYKEQGGDPSDLAPGQLKKTEEEKEKGKKPKKEKTRTPKPND